VAVVSENGQSLANVDVTAKLYNLDASEKWSHSAKIDVTPDAAAVAFNVAPPADMTTTYFLKLTAIDASGKQLSENFYWLSTKPDELAWEKTHDTVNTPQSAYADMTALQDLAPVSLRVQTKPAASPCATPFAVKPAAGPISPPVASAECDGGLLYQELTVSNPTKTLAFMVHLRLVKGDGDDVVPAFFDDNFVSLLPGEVRGISVRYRAADLGKAPAHFEVNGWNVQPENLPLR
jgi:exo-1,4-beta-D-glucosaminidase